MDEIIDVIESLDLVSIGSSRRGTKATSFEKKPDSGRGAAADGDFVAIGQQVLDNEAAGIAGAAGNENACHELPDVTSGLICPDWAYRDWAWPVLAMRQSPDSVAGQESMPEIDQRSQSFGFGMILFPRFFILVMQHADRWPIPKVRHVEPDILQHVHRDRQAMPICEKNSAKMSGRCVARRHRVCRALPACFRMSEGWVLRRRPRNSAGENRQGFHRRWVPPKIPDSRNSGRCFSRPAHRHR